MSRGFPKSLSIQELHNMVQYPDIVKRTQEYQIEVPKLHNMVQYQDM